MPSIFLSMITYSLNVSLYARPVRQNKMKFSQDIIQAVKDKIDKLLKVGFIKEV